MENSNPLAPKQIAPCGMNCGLCSKYLAYRNNLKRSQCPGCRQRGEPCSYLFARCSGINHGQAERAAFCFHCEQYPCQQLKRMDARYRKNYGMSTLLNLEYIHQHGEEAFLEEQTRQHRCTRCGEMISVHNGRCFSCDPISKLVEKTEDRT